MIPILNLPELQSIWLIDAQVFYFSGHIDQAYHCLESYFGYRLLNDSKELLGALDTLGKSNSYIIQLIANILSSYGKHKPASELYKQIKFEASDAKFGLGTLENKIKSGLLGSSDILQLLDSVANIFKINPVNFFQNCKKTMSDVRNKDLHDVPNVGLSHLQADLVDEFPAVSDSSEMMTQVGQAIGKALRASLPYNPDDMFETVRWHLENIKNGDGSSSLVDLVEDLVMPTIFLQLDPSVRRRLLRSSDCLKDLYSELALLVRDCKNSNHSIFKDLPPTQRLDYMKAKTKVCDYDTVIAVNVKQLGSLLYMRGENELADSYFSYAKTILDELFGKNAVVIQNADLYREIGSNALNWD